jgi:hypothetical protein
MCIDPMGLRVEGLLRRVKSLELEALKVERLKWKPRSQGFGADLDEAKKNT